MGPNGRRPPKVQGPVYPNPMTPLECAHAPLAALIRHALACLDTVLAQPERYRVDMSGWHTAANRSKKPVPTRVCWAGAVMVVTLKADPTRTYDATDFPTHWGPLRALNWVRSGFVAEALEALGRPCRWANRPIRDWNTDREGFRADMLALADELSPHTTRDQHGTPVREGDTVRCLDPVGALERGAVYEVARILDPGRIQLTSLECAQTDRFVLVMSRVAPIPTIGRGFPLTSWAHYRWATMPKKVLEAPEPEIGAEVEF